MITLNLTANDNAEQRIKDYLENNVSKILADKINNGVQIQKDGLTLISKKDLSGFMRFATDEAKKLAEKNARCACVDDQTVYGWAIHYFEEDAFEGKLYNLDGTEYKPAVKESVKTVEPIKREPKPQDQQASIFDILDGPFNVPVNIPNFNKFEPKVETKQETVITPNEEVKNDNKYLTILNEILGGIVKEY